MGEQRPFIIIVHVIDAISFFFCIAFFRSFRVNWTAPRSERIMIDDKVLQFIHENREINFCARQHSTCVCIPSIWSFVRRKNPPMLVVYILASLFCFSFSHLSVQIFKTGFDDFLNICAKTKWYRYEYSSNHHCGKLFS